jgi:hypothetical protein
MTKQLKIAAAALALFSIGSSAYAAGLPCPFNDKKLPEKTKVCRAGTIHRCEDGQWINLGMKCSNYKEDELAALANTRRILGEASPRRSAIVARIAPQS